MKVSEAVRAQSKSEICSLSHVNAMMLPRCVEPVEFYIRVSGCVVAILKSVSSRCRWSLVYTTLFRGINLVAHVWPSEEVTSLDGLPLTNNDHGADIGEWSFIPFVR